MKNIEKKGERDCITLSLFSRFFVPSLRNRCLFHIDKI